jgi:hypothetical protein
MVNRRLLRYGMGTMPTTNGGDSDLPDERLRLIESSPWTVDHRDIREMSREIRRLRERLSDVVQAEAWANSVGRQAQDELQNARAHLDRIRSLVPSMEKPNERTTFEAVRDELNRLRASLRQHEEAEAIRAKALGSPTCAHPAFTKEPNFGGVSMLPSPEFVTVLSPPEASKAAETQAKPAEVLGEAFRLAMCGAAYAADADQRALQLRRAVAELAKAVERMGGR